MNQQATYMPGRLQPARPPIQGRKRFGLIRMAPSSHHMIPIKIGNGPLQHVECEAHTEQQIGQPVKKHVLCLGQGCSGKRREDEQAMLREHPRAQDMEASRAIHVWGFWSDAPLGSKVEGCKGCKESKDVPCADHFGGVVGLIAPATLAEVQ